MLVLTFLLLTNWTTEVVTTGGVFISPNNIAIDSSGNPYILVLDHRDYVPRPVYYLFLYSKVEGIWTADTFEINADEPLPIPGPDLTIDRFNRIWCIYNIYVNGNEYLIVARKDSLGWVRDTISLGGACFRQSIATDTLGVPHIAYDDFVNGYQHGFYAYLNDTIWQKTLVDSYINDFCCSIDLDSYNHPHISYFSIDTIYGYDVLSHAMRIDTVWYCEEIDYTNYVSWWTTSICVGPDNLPGIVYKDPNTYQLKYAYFDGAAWNVDTIEPSGYIETQKALDIDSLSKPYFIYTQSYNSWLTYKTDSGWYKEHLPLTPTVTKGFAGALRIGRDGIIHITRFATNNDYTYREIHYIYGTPEGIEETRDKAPGTRYRLEIHPNPFRNKTEFSFGIAHGAKCIELKIYDATGRLVKDFPRLTLNAQRPTLLSWHGRDNFGHQLPAGVYFIRLDTDKFTCTKKIIKLD